MRCLFFAQVTSLSLDGSLLLLRHRVVGLCNFRLLCRQEFRLRLNNSFPLRGLELRERFIGLRRPQLLGIQLLQMSGNLAKVVSVMMQP